VTPFDVNGDVGAGPDLGSVTAYNGVPTISISQPGGRERKIGDTINASSADNENAYIADANTTDVPPGLPPSSNVHELSAAGYSGGGGLGIVSNTMAPFDDAPPAYDPPTIQSTIRED
jgi:hypothetical protein